MARRVVVAKQARVLIVGLFDKILLVGAQLEVRILGAHVRQDEERKEKEKRKLHGACRLPQE